MYLEKMTESSASVNSGELTVKGVVDWASSVFEDEDKEFTYSCQLERNAKRSERQENVEDKETDQPISIKDAPHLNKEEIKSEFPISQNVEEFKEPTVKLDRLPENVSLPTDSGYCSAANSLDKSLNNEEQLSSYTGDNKNSSHTFRRTCKNEILMNETVEDMCEKNTERKQNKERKSKKLKKDVGKKIIQILKPVLRKVISRTQNYSLFKILNKELRRYFKQKGNQNYNRSKKLLIPVMKSGILDLNRILCTKFLIAYPLPWMYMHELPENMRIEWLRVYSFATFSSQKISNFLLAKHGFYFDKDKGKIQCFACDKSYKWEELENTEDCNVKLKTSLHEDWCLIADGNVPIHPSPVNSLGISEGLPSCNKRKFKDEGRIITCLELCGLNTFFVDQGNMLKEFPVLIDKYENYNSGDGSINPFQVILTMLRKGERNSARGMREILLQTKLIKPSETTINQIHFELIRFVCELMKGKIIVKGKCGCPNEIVNKEEQIFISDCECSECESKNCREFAHGMHFFQDWIDRRFNSRCSVCKGQIIWTLPEPPPCLFLKLWHLNLRMEHLPKVIHVLGNRYILGSIYLHANQHFTAWVSRPHGMAFYDDNNVDEHDKFSAKFDDCKEFPGGGKPCLASYFIS